MGLSDLYSMEKVYKIGIAIGRLDVNQSYTEEIKSAINTLEKDFERLENLILSQRLDVFEKSQLHQG